MEVFSPHASFVLRLSSRLDSSAHTQLAHEAQHVHVIPRFNDLAVSNAQDSYLCELHVLACGRDTEKLTVMRTRLYEAGGHPVVAGGHMGDLHVEIGEGRTHHLHDKV